MSLKYSIIKGYLFNSPQIQLIKSKEIIMFKIAFCYRKLDVYFSDTTDFMFDWLVFIPSTGLHLPSYN